MSALITIKDILVKKGVRIILDVPYLSAQRGESFAIVGPNGAGKTTLLMCLSCLERLARGSLFLREQQVGKELSNLDFRKKTAVVFQQSLLFNTSVFDNVAYGLRLRNLSKQEIASRVMDYLGYFNIGDLAKRSARTLSGGEAQRVALARALVLEPEVLLLDEPFASLDAPTSEKIITELKSTVKKTSTTLFLVTHNRLEALQLANKLIALENGRIVQEGFLIDVFQKPANDFVASFAGIDVVLRGEVMENHDGLLGVKIANKRIEAVGPFDSGRRVAAFIRPENVVLSIADLSHISAKNHFPAKIIDTVPFGHYHKVTLDCGFVINSVVTNSTVTELGLAIGKDIFVSFKATAVHLVAE